MTNNAVRILTAVVGVPLLVFIFISEGWFYFGFSVIVSSVCLWEFHNLFINKGFNSLRVLSIVLSLLILIVSFINPPLTISVLIISFFILISCEVFRKNHNPLNSFISISGLIYITLPFVLTFELNSLYNFKPVLLMIILVWVCDSAAYFIGMKFGKHKLTEISPKKTWEGSIGGFIFAVITAFVYRQFFINDITIVDAAVIGFIGGTASQIGDLFESMLKRYSGIKDSSSIIPGHGGFLDRFDSFLFISLPFFIYLVFVKPLL